MKVKHLQSSTQIISLGDIKILTDPWLTDGEYYGSWYHYPPFGDFNIENLKYDFIYVSHIHPDHLSEKTFKKLPLKTPVLIHNYESKFVKRKIEMLNFEVIELNNGEPYIFSNGGKITIYAADNCDPQLCSKFIGCGVVESKFGSTQIDTLATFEFDDQVILNTNDCPFELASQTIVANAIHTKKIDLLLLGYAGAGPYPQCFEFDNPDERVIAAEAKKNQFLNYALNYIKLVKPVTYAPFAGTYILGSKLSQLTPYRGVPLVSEALAWLQDKYQKETEGIHLEKLDEFDISDKSIDKHLNDFGTTYNDYLDLIANYSLEYENDSWDDSEISKLIHDSYLRFKRKADEIDFKSETVLVVQSEKTLFKFSVNEAPRFITSLDEVQGDFVRVSLDHKLLHRLLRGPRYAHWNNAEIGSHLKFLRRPDKFERGLYHCLYFFHK